MWPFPRIIAHRGGGTLAPENTLAAMRCGLDHGFHAVEFDVMLAGDGIPVLMHDPVFGRTIAGEGSVAETTAAALTAMDAGAWFDARHAGEPVPLFADVVNFCEANGIWMNVEIKPAPGYAEATGRAVAAHLAKVRAAQGEGRPATLLSSFSIDALLAAKETAPELPRGWLVSFVPDDWEDTMEGLGAVAVHTNHKHLTPERAREIKAAGYGLFCYTVNEPERARELLAWGVDAFCTDRLDLIGPDFS
jgi:glycerophosphoryl diester phosphodiesterase